MSQREQALLAWLSNVIETQIVKVDELRNSQHFYALSEKIEGFGSLALSESSLGGWQTNYVNLKNLFEQINSPIPSKMAPINLIDIAKGEDQQNEGLITLLTFLFIACIESKNKEYFIGHIMNLKQAEQQQLMMLIQENNARQSTQSNSQYDVVEEENKKMDELYFTLQSVYAENQSLQQQLAQEAKEQKKLVENMKKLQDQLKKVKLELQQKTIYLHQHEQRQIQRQTSTKIISQSNQEAIHELKSQFLAQEQKYLSDIRQLNTEIETLRDELQIARDKNAQLQESQFNVQSRKVQHKDCITIVQHKNIIYDLQMKVKNGNTKNWQLERKILLMESQIAECNRKLQKQRKQKQKIQVGLSQKPTGEYISKKNAHQLKIDILRMLKVDLEKKLMNKYPS